MTELRQAHRADERHRRLTPQRPGRPARVDGLLSERRAAAMLDKLAQDSGLQRRQHAMLKAGRAY